MSNINSFTSNPTEKGAYNIERIKQETSAAQNKTSSIASTYADQAKGTASDVVASVQDTEGQAAHVTDDFHSRATAQTDAAVNEGQKNVEAMKATAAGYVDQGKTLAGNALSTAQEYVSGSYGNSSATASQSGVISSLQSTANTTLETSKAQLASAQESVQAQLQSTQETVQPYLDRAQATVQPHLEAAIAAAKPYAEKAQSTLASTLGSGNGDGKGQSS